MIQATDFVEAARARGFGLWTGVPCSYLQPFINHVIGSDLVKYVAAANEGDAVAIASGAELGGTRGVVMFQNSGLGNAVNPLTSLNHVFRLPVLLIVTLRGEPGGAADEPQHALMGAITTRLLEDMGLPWEYFPAEAEQIAACLDRVDSHARKEGRPYALVMLRDTVHPCAAPPVPDAARPAASRPANAGPARHLRHEYLRILRQAIRPLDLVVATTGYTGRELYALGDAPNQFYMVGSMGCASSFGLGLALACPARRVIVLDGDGAMLMRMGALAAIGAQHPRNLVHIVFDNGVHESTGGQAVAHTAVNFGAIAAEMGYARAHCIDSPSQLQDTLDAGHGPALIHVAVLPGILETLPRPEITPEQVARRLRGVLAQVEAT
jgi:phosphonopyruvate decarboxylase